jgi:Domain of unknown function (DUF4375)
MHVAGRLAQTVFVSHRRKSIRISPAPLGGHVMKKTWEVWNDIIERLPTGLTPTEQVVFCVNSFLFNFENGGWLYNLSPSAGWGERWSELRDTAECVAAIGAPEVAQTLRDVASVVESANVQEHGTWDEFLAKADPTQKIDQWEQRISKEIPGLWDKLTEYTLAHFECERD